jgi:hypothetical protein
MMMGIGRIGTREEAKPVTLVLNHDFAYFLMTNECVTLTIITVRIISITM